MGKSERVEGQQSLHTGEGPTCYLYSATPILGEEGRANLIFNNHFEIRVSGI
jgi:hypothetical protein